VRRRLAAIAGFVLVLVVLWPWINGVMLAGTRFYAGAHRQFFLRCASLPEGGTVEQTLGAMEGYVLAANNEVLDRRLASSHQPAPDPDGRSIGADSSVLILPAKSAHADWCICYFREGRLVETVVAPD
jgi:hypothetical protein